MLFLMICCEDFVILDALSTKTRRYISIYVGYLTAGFYNELNAYFRTIKMMLTVMLIVIACHGKMIQMILIM